MPSAEYHLYLSGC